MDNVKKINILDILEQCSEIKLIGNINGKEEHIELDNITRAMLVGYFIKKRTLHK